MVKCIHIIYHIWYTNRVTCVPHTGLGTGYTVFE